MTKQRESMHVTPFEKTTSSVLSVLLLIHVISKEKYLPCQLTDRQTEMLLHIDPKVSSFRAKFDEDFANYFFQSKAKFATCFLKL